MSKNSICLIHVSEPNVASIKFISFCDKSLKILLILFYWIEMSICFEKIHEQITSSVFLFSDRHEDFVTIICQEPDVPCVQVDSQPSSFSLLINTAENFFGMKVNPKRWPLPLDILVSVENDNSLNAFDICRLCKEHNAHIILYL